MSAPDPRQHFEDLVAHVTDGLEAAELLTASFSGEDSEFVRFNGGDVRQAGSVVQRTISLDLAEGRRHTTGSVRLTGDRDTDRRRLADLVVDLRARRAVVPEDPFHLVNTEPESSERVVAAELPDAGAAVADVRSTAAGLDLVGILALGDVQHGFANSLGQRNWSSSSTFNLDWSCYLRADKAAKNGYAGTEWDQAVFADRLDWTRQQLAVLDRTPMDLEPGRYRTFLAPAAVKELLDILSWGGFGLKSHKTLQTPMLKMVTEDVRLAPGVDLVEDTVGGVGPGFSAEGFRRPDRVPLIEEGRYVGHLVSARSAAEYDVDTNGAGSWESPESLSLSPGGLPAERVLDALGTGLHVGNLWYLNWSDRMACRTTGMTRFATFWVDEGEIVAPVNVLRFDDTGFRLLGDELEDLTDTAETVLESSTYGERSTDSARVPGALVREMTFTL